MAQTRKSVDTTSAGGSILVVCAANLMRSPLAAAFLSQDLEQRGREDIVVTCAGTKADPAAGNVPAVLRIARDYGLDLSTHRATELSRDMVMRADLVLTMTEEQRSAVVRLLPAAVSRTFTLIELRRLTEGSDAAGLNPAQLAALAHRARPTTAPPSEPEDIMDPVGRPLRHLLRVAAQLRAAVRTIALLLADNNERQPVRA
jgi:protein-tyrosine phosphatase